MDAARASVAPNIGWDGRGRRSPLCAVSLSRGTDDHGRVCGGVPTIPSPGKHADARIYGTCTIEGGMFPAGSLFLSLQEFAQAAVHVALGLLHRLDRAAADMRGQEEVVMSAGVCDQRIFGLRGGKLAIKHIQCCSGNAP